MLEKIDLPAGLDERPLPKAVRGMIHDLHLRIEAFQDRWDVPQIEQFVAADYELVFQTLAWIRQSQVQTGNRFLEWGCGFAAVTVMADALGWNAIGIESEVTLIEHGRKTVQDWTGPMRDGLRQNVAAETVGDASPPELIVGNFLPAGAEALADDPTLPSLGHPVASAYDELGLDLDDFAVVYSYPWPGEDEFHETVFAKFAAPGSILVQFAGPHDMRAWRRLASRRFA
ncbi:class I SAM-dependent methyltransferase [Neorhodopirellula pilleata]|uniref:Class I SAM-dependent methyltransferase n=1 Tax=Neorhodopirellula pilleata TaxID=2714738 RepID=A0A5C6AV22_9BACT|nr:class I SAM-dependent methyltransferase [Neorhodopirellula pilleata]TWU03865.1 hypothetical protein Pla100_08000 [Neorhodopirellula pilleata]